MANLADCAFAVAKDDIYKMNGAIRRAEPGEKSTVVYKSTYKDGDTEYTYWYKYVDGKADSCRIKSGGQTIYEGRGIDGIKEAQEKMKNMKHIDFSIATKDTLVENGWVVDWLKLNAFSYDYTPSVAEYGDHITVFFGGRWSFPSSLEDKLNEFGVLWQGAGCEDGMDWQDDEMGNTDFGLRIGKDTDYCNGEKYVYHFVEDRSENM